MSGLRVFLIIALVILAGGCVTKPQAETKAPSIPSVTIVSPKEGEIIQDTEVTIEVEVSNFILKNARGAKISGEGSIHYTLDSRFSFDTDKKQNTFVRVSAGQHFLGVELVYNDGSSLSPRTIDFVNFITESKLSVTEDQWPSLLGE